MRLEDEMTDWKGRAEVAAGNLISEHGYPRDNNVVFHMLALAWLLGHQAGTEETLALAKESIEQATTDLAEAFKAAIRS